MRGISEWTALCGVTSTQQHGREESTTHIEERIVSGGTEIYCVFPSFRFALVQASLFCIDLSCEDMFFLLSKI